MALFVVVTHEYDVFALRLGYGRPAVSGYLLFHALRALNEMGHSWRVSAGPDAGSADAAILHVDATHVPEAYLALASRYPVAINFRAGDISKRRIGKGLLRRGDDWPGPVIVKTDLNCHGRPEAVANARAAQAGRPAPYAEVVKFDDYPIIASLAEVPDSVWDDERLIVQRFLPERDSEGYALRVWIFAGGRERCSRLVSPDPIVKADNVVSRRLVDVPPELRAERERLGFDFGKFDFVVHEGEPILLDVNRTPGMSPKLADVIKEGARNLAHGFAEMVSG